MEMAKKTKKKGPGRYSARNRKVPPGQGRKWKRRHGKGILGNSRDFNGGRDDDFDLDAFMEKMQKGQIF